MPTDPDHDGKRTALATGALLMLPALCCGLPLLIASGALAGLGSVLGNPWVIGTAIALVVAGVAWRVRRHASTSITDRECCAPEPGTQDNPATQPPAAVAGATHRRPGHGGRTRSAGRW